jgi:hypothetical protein
MVGPNARWVVAVVAHEQAIGDWTEVDDPGDAGRSARLARDVQPAVSMVVAVAGPFPTSAV